MRKILVIFGTRPEAIKCAPVIRKLHSDPRFDPVVLSTGQHRQMLHETLDSLGIRPDIDLDVMTSGQSLSQVTHRVLQGLAERLGTLGAEAVLVHGDTATTLAGALGGFHHQIPVVHIEAGLRSGHLHSPFPEEANRRLVAQISELHLAPTHGNSANLIRERIDEGRIVVTGNTVVDALHWACARDVGYGDPALEGLDTDPRRIVLASAHRRESWSRLPDIGRALRTVASDRGVHVIVPLHRNPAVRAALLPEIADAPHVTVVDPLPYTQFCRLMRRADLILSDSSGAEEEGPALGTPTLVLRDVTERPEAIASGTARLVGRETGRVVDEVRSLLGDTVRYRMMADAPNPYGDGRASERVVDALAHFFGDGPAVVPFVPGRTAFAVAA